VVTSNQATIWAAFKIGIVQPSRGLGKLLENLTTASALV